MDQNCIDIEEEIVESVHKHVEDFLDSYDKQLSEPEQYAAILMAFDKLIEKCSKGDEPVEKKIIAEHYGDELIEKVKEKGLDIKVKELYMKGF